MKIQSKVYLCSMDSAESGGGIEGRCKVLVTAAVCARNQRTRGGRSKNPTAEGHPVRVWNYYLARNHGLAESSESPFSLKTNIMAWLDMPWTHGRTRVRPVATSAGPEHVGRVWPPPDPHFYTLGHHSAGSI